MEEGRSSTRESIIKTSPVKTRRKFDIHFKLEAVRNWLGSGKSAAVVAKELGLEENRLYGPIRIFVCGAGSPSGRLVLH
jgi:transposase-like protein